MKCEKCGKYEATTHIRSVINGVVREYNLCSECAAGEGYGNVGHNSLAGMLASMFGDFAPTGIMSSTLKCSVCGATFSDIAKSGKVGCAECYNTFRSDLLPYLKRVHGSTKHSGKVPLSNHMTVVKNEETPESLRMELNRLVSEEKYEQAAVIRDKIKKLEGEMQ